MPADPLPVPAPTLEMRDGRPAVVSPGGLWCEAAPSPRPTPVATVSSGGRGRPVADLVERIERRDPALVAAARMSSASLRAGDLVRSMRRSAGMTQADLAAALGVSQPRVSDIEAGIGPQGPTWDVMQRVASTCGGRLCAVREGAPSPEAAALAERLAASGVPRAALAVVTVDGAPCVRLDPGEAGGLPAFLRPLATVVA